MMLTSARGIVLSRPMSIHRTLRPPSILFLGSPMLTGIFFRATAGLSSVVSPGSFVKLLFVSKSCGPLCLVSSMIGFAALYAAGFSRFGSGRFIALAIFLLVIVKLVESVVSEPARTNLDLWYLVYALSVVDLVMFWVLMYLSINPNALRKQNKLSGQNT